MQHHIFILVAIQYYSPYMHRICLRLKKQKQNLIATDSYCFVCSDSATNKTTYSRINTFSSLVDSNSTYCTTGTKR